MYYKPSFILFLVHYFFIITLPLFGSWSVLATTDIDRDVKMKAAHTGMDNVINSRDKRSYNGTDRESTMTTTMTTTTTTMSTMMTTTTRQQPSGSKSTTAVAGGAINKAATPAGTTPKPPAAKKNSATKISDGLMVTQTKIFDWMTALVLFSSSSQWMFKF